MRSLKDSETSRGIKIFWYSKTMVQVQTRLIETNDNCNKTWDGRRRSVVNSKTQPVEKYSHRQASIVYE